MAGMHLSFGFEDGPHDGYSTTLAPPWTEGIVMPVPVEGDEDYEGRYDPLEIVVWHQGSALRVHGTTAQCGQPGATMSVDGTVPEASCEACRGDGHALETADDRLAGVRVAFAEDALSLYLSEGWLMQKFIDDDGVAADEEDLAPAALPESAPSEADEDDEEPPPKRARR
jgi:hypothetical protein